MRQILSRTEGLTDTIGTANPVVRTLFNQLGPWIGGTDAVQENATAAMSQVALSYRDSPLFSNHARAGSLRAGYRVPDLVVRRVDGGGQPDARLHQVLDASEPMLLLATAGEAEVLEECRAAMGHGPTVRLIPAEGGANAFHDMFGHAGLAVLVRPDGYAGVVSPFARAAGTSPPTAPVGHRCDRTQ